jgi:hypothetical protein
MGRRMRGLWPVVLLAVSLLVVGCGRSTEPVQHEVRKPVTEEKPPAILYPDIPEVPQQLEGPSAPIGQKPKSPE